MTETTPEEGADEAAVMLVPMTRAETQEMVDDLYGHGSIDLEEWRRVTDVLSGIRA